MSSYSRRFPSPSTMSTLTAFIFSRRISVISASSFTLPSSLTNTFAPTATSLTSPCIADSSSACANSFSILIFSKSSAAFCAFEDVSPYCSTASLYEICAFSSPLVCFSNLARALRTLDSSTSITCSVSTKPSLDIAASFSPVWSLNNSVKALFKVVPACEPLIPALAISPRTTAKSSIFTFIAPARGAQYLKLSPINATFVLAFEDAAARTSEKCPASSA